MLPDSEESLNQYDSTSLKNVGDSRVSPEFKPKTPNLKSVRGGIRQRVFFILLLFATVPGYVILFLSYFTASETLKGQLQQQTEESTQRLALEVDRNLGILNQTLTELAQNGDGVESEMKTSDPQLVRVEGLTKNLETVVTQLPEGSLYFLCDADGNLVSEIHGISFNDIPIGSEEITSRFVRSKPILDREDGVIIVDAISSNIEWFILSVPLQNTSEKIHLGVLVPASSFFSPILTQFGARDRNTYIVSNRNEIIYSRSIFSYDSSLLSELYLALEEKDADERRYFEVANNSGSIGFAAQQIRSALLTSRDPNSIVLQWDIVESVDLEVTLVTLNRLFWGLTMLGILLTIIAMLTSIWLSARFVSPILELTAGMRRFARGELDYRVSVTSGDELENLADAANIMAESLRNSYSSLANRMLELDEKANQLSLIYSISRSINRSLDLDALFDQIVKELRGIVECDRVSLAMYYPEENKLELAYVYPHHRDILPKGAAIPLKRSVMGRALKESTITLKSLKPNGKYFEEQELIHIGINRICIVPLIATNGPVGTLNLGSVSTEAFTMNEIKLLERVAETLGLAVEHGRLYQRVNQFAEKLEETVAKRTQELETAQERLVQTEKFAATGAIAAHIGHELNNPLSIIKNYCKIAMGRLLISQPSTNDLQETRDGLKIIEEEIDRIARIVGQLRQVSKPVQTQPIRLILHEELTKMSELFKVTMKQRGTEITTEFNPEIKEVVLSVDSLRQIIINLIRNSIDALEDQEAGRIVIKTDFANHDHTEFYIAIKDTGPGIPPENLSSIFDPFYTTKKAGKGTGLGLSVSYGLAQSMGGTLQAASTLGKGTTITVILPIDAPDPNRDGDKEHRTTKNSDSAINTPMKKRNRNIMIG